MERAINLLRSQLQYEVDIRQDTEEYIERISENLVEARGALESSKQREAELRTALDKLTNA